MSTFRVVESASAAVRLDAAASFLQSLAPDQPITIVAATRGAADDFARRIAAGKQATFALQRLSLTQLAARAAMVALAGDGRTPSTFLGEVAVASRAVFDATRRASLDYLGPVADTPGFPRALARTLHELRLSGIGSTRLTTLPRAGADLADLIERVDRTLATSGTADRADLFGTAAHVLRRTPIRGVVVFLDVPLDHPADVELVEAAIWGADVVLATVPHADRRAAAALASMGGTFEHPSDPDIGDLACLRQFLFNTGGEQPPVRELDGSLEFFSAPGEGRECVEIARRVLAQAAAGIRFDEMAILVRSPERYLGLLEHALGRADVPAWFERGTRRPHPAGRAFLALLACASERLSAARFSEYLSLGQVPAGAAPLVRHFVRPTDDVFGFLAWAPEASVEEEEDPDAAADAADGGDPDRSVMSGTLRAPWRWEGLLVESAVIGQDPARWQRRLDGRARELSLQLREARREESGSGTVRGLELAQQQLAHLRAFALPIIEELASWPREATWGEWLDRFERLIPSVLRVPGQVLRVFADLRPMAGVGPVDLEEARRVLAERLLTLEAKPPVRRFGRVFVGTPGQARGRTFRVVFVPGLAERLFPQKPREDPLLLDDLRSRLDASLATQTQRLVSERLLLQLAAGAASSRLYVSYPRIELNESRPRVPSFYALDVIRAATGRLPDHEWLEERARQAGNATLAWPAPLKPEDAIDDQEHDLAVLRGLLDNKDRDAVRGHAHYLLSLNESLRRSVIDRWAHGQSRWSANDGLIQVTNRTRAALAAQRLTARSYSLSALQRFSACPYQFVLAAIYRLQPMVLPEPLQRMDPLTRGSIFHDIQARFFRALQKQGALPVTAATRTAAAIVLDATIDEVAASEHDQLAPAVERIWRDEIAAIRRDLQSWLRYVAEAGGEWHPRFFEFAFGKVPGERDASSVREDVTLPEGFKLRGAIDLIEAHAATGLLRVTDHKTGRRPERLEKVIVGGGAVLQPVLYGMAVEAALGARVSHGRLFFCTAAGSFSTHEIPLNDVTREAGLDILRVIDRAIADGSLAASPTEEACGRCDFRPVCGPDVFRRVARKPQDRLLDLAALRGRP